LEDNGFGVKKIRIAGLLGIASSILIFAEEKLGVQPNKFLFFWFFGLIIFTLPFSLLTTLFGFGSASVMNIYALKKDQLG
jgi:hypothetical protein